MFARKQKSFILNFVIAIVLLGGLLGMKVVEQVHAATTIVVENANDSGDTPSSTDASLASREAGANAPQLIIETAP